MTDKPITLTPLPEFVASYTTPQVAKLIEEWATRAILADRASNATAQGMVPEGWKLVPLEPTDDMKHAANEKYRCDRQTTAGDLYRTMLRAAPTAPTAPGQGVMGAEVAARIERIAKNIHEMASGIVDYKTRRDIAEAALAIMVDAKHNAATPAVPSQGAE